MKKKLLYGLMGLLFALSLVGFVACDDDDDDGDGTVTTTDITDNADGTTTTTTTTTNTDGSSTSTATTTDEDGNVTSTVTTETSADGSSSSTTTDSDGTVTNTTATDSSGNETSTDYTYDEDGNTTGSTTTMTDSEGNEAATVEKTVSEDKTITAEISWAADSAVEIIPKSELVDAKTVTIHVDEVEGMTWNTMCSASDWSNQVPGFFTQVMYWDSNKSALALYDDCDDVEISAATLITYQTYLDNGVYLGGPKGASMTITYTVGYTDPDDPYTITLDKALSTSAPVQILTADEVKSYSEVQVVFNQTSTENAEELYLCTGDSTTDVVETFGSAYDPYVYFIIYDYESWGLEHNFGGDGWLDITLSDFKDGGLYLYTNTSGTTYSIGVKESSE